MRYLLIPLTLLLATAGFITAEEPSKPASDCCNTVCPMDGKAIDPAVPLVEVAMGDAADAPKVKVGTCSNTCAAELAANPPKHRVAVWATMKDKESQSLIKGFPVQEVLDSCCNKTCPVDGKPIDPKLAPMSWKPINGPKHPEHKAVLIGFCSSTCMDTFKADPEKYFQPAWLEGKSQLVK